MLRCLPNFWEIESIVLYDHFATNCDSCLNDSYTDVANAFHIDDSTLTDF